MALNTSTCEWIELFPSTTPAKRGGHALVWDSVNSRFIMFGGYTSVLTYGPPFTCKNDTWTYGDGAEDWVELFPATSPTARFNMAFAYRPSDGHILLWGGTTSPSPGSFVRNYDTWEWDGSTWAEVHTANHPPTDDTLGGAAEPGLFWSEHLGVWLLTLFNTTSAVIETWAYDGTDWALRDHSGDMIVTNRQGIVGFGYPWHSGWNAFSLAAGGSKDHTYYWDNSLSDWVELGTAHAPLARHGAALCFDEDKGILFSGDIAIAGALGTVSDTQTWTFDGEDWAQFIPGGTAPHRRYECPFAWDNDNGRALLFGGTLIPNFVHEFGPSYDLSFNDETWELTSLPAVVAPPNLHLAPFRVPINNQGVPSMG